MQFCPTIRNFTIKLSVEYMACFCVIDFCSCAYGCRVLLRAFELLNVHIGFISNTPLSMEYKPCIQWCPTTLAHHFTTRKQENVTNATECLSSLLETRRKFFFVATHDALYLSSISILMNLKISRRHAWPNIITVGKGS